MLKNELASFCLNNLMIFFNLQDSVFHGVICFYFQEHISGNCAPKCICISSTSSTQEVIETLLEKFQHDGTSHPLSYSLYEVLRNQGESRTEFSSCLQTLHTFVLSLCCHSLNVLCFRHLEERKLDLSVKPLVVQLNWNKDTDGDLS